MHDTDYAYAVANIRANEIKLLTKADLTSLISAKSDADVIRMLKDRGYGGSRQFTNEDEMLKMQNQEIFCYVKELAKDSDVFNIFIMKQDFHNLKIAIKSKITKSFVGNLFMTPSLLEPDVIKNAVYKEEFSLLPKFMRETAKKAYDVAAKTNDGQLCDIIIDKAYLEEMMNRANEINNSFLIKLCNVIIATYNLKTALRALKSNKSQEFIADALVRCDFFDVEKLAQASSSTDDILDFIKTTQFAKATDALKKGLSAFEKYCDNIIIEHIKTVKYNAFGIEPIIAYLICNEMEQKNVRIILAGKRFQIPSEMILERMREVYV